MVSSTGLFSQVVSEICSRVDFDRFVEKHGAERASKGFTCKTQLVSMLFCHFAFADSLRAITNGMQSCEGSLSHLGVKLPKRSTLAYANAHRPAALFQDYFFALLEQYRAYSPMLRRKKKFRFKSKLYSFDSSTITLSLSLFPWASYRQAKGGVKIHVLLDHDDYMPAFVQITNANVHDSQMSKCLSLNTGSIIVMDRGYVDYAQFYAWEKSQVRFVTRLKDNAVYETVQSRTLPRHRGNLVLDEEVRLTSSKALENYPKTLRRVVVHNEENDEDLVLLTNDFQLSAATIAEIYKDRWEIELFFKTLKQNLKVKTFVGTSENALRIQLWTALISLLTLKWLHYLSQAGWSFVSMVMIFRLNLLTFRDLMAWLREPIKTPPLVPNDGQVKLPFRMSWTAGLFGLLSVGGYSAFSAFCACAVRLLQRRFF